MVPVVVGAALLWGGTPASAQQSAQQKQKPKAAETPQAEEAAAEEPVPPPVDIEPPDDAPPIVKLENELITEEQDEETRKRLAADLRRAVRAGDLRRSRKIVEEGTRWRVYRMTLKKHRRALDELRNDIVREAASAGGLQTNPTSARQFREFYLSEIAKYAAELLQGHNLYVRLNAAYLLAQLNLQEEDRIENVPVIAYTPAAVPLAGLIESQEQPEAVKIAAANGLHRIMLYGKADNALKLRIANALIAELNRTDTHYWYQMRLAEALGGIDLELDLNNKPFIVDALARIVVDEKREPVVRAEAAQSLGRVPLDPQVNVRLLAFESANLARQLAEWQMRVPDKYYWKHVFFNVYLAYKPRSEFGVKRGDGLLAKVDKAPHNQSKSYVEESYKQILPVVQTALSQQNGVPLPQKVVAPLGDWVKNNQPESFSVHPGLQPIRTKQISKAADAPSR
ncbi:MAG: hypothetical protein ACREJB_13795 [Planctomycetaceae bacterium]